MSNPSVIAAPAAADAEIWSLGIRHSLVIRAWTLVIALLAKCAMCSQAASVWSIAFNMPTNTVSFRQPLAKVARQFMPVGAPARRKSGCFGPVFWVLRRGTSHALQWRDNHVMT
jgi:hypothetical protein